MGSSKDGNERDCRIFLVLVPLLLSVNGLKASRKVVQKARPLSRGHCDELEKPNGRRTGGPLSVMAIILKKRCPIRNTKQAEFLHYRITAAKKKIGLSLIRLKKIRGKSKGSSGLISIRLSKKNRKNTIIRYRSFVRLAVFQRGLITNG